MFTIEKLLNFLDNNKLPKNTIFISLDKETNSFGFINHLSYLNIEGAYDWIKPEGDKLTGKHGDYVSTIENYKGKISDRKVDRISNYNNMTGGTNGIAVLNYTNLRKELDRMEPKSDAQITTWHPFSIVNGIEILPKTVCLEYHDPYGHKVELHVEDPIVAFIKGDKLKQEVKNESYIIKYNDFI
jgi:hypothetical protein